MELYLIYRRFPHPTDTEQRRLLGKLVIFDNQIRVLEDHDNVLSEMFPSGPVNAMLIMRLKQLEHSPYFSVIKDSDVSQGKIEDEIPELNLMPAEWKKPE